MRRYCTFFFIAITVVSAFMVSGCATTKQTPSVEQHPAVENTPALPIKQQQQIAMKTYNDMLNLTGEHPRKEVLPQLMAGYEKIIREAPDTYLAEESHLRLIIHYFEDFPMPQPDKAEEVYRQYFKKYKHPKMGPGITFTMARLYYNYQMWDRLASFMVPYMQEYVKTGKIADKLFFLYYSEAKFHLKDYDEAAKGFRIMIREKLPGMELNFAHKRLLEIQQLIKKRTTKEQ